MILKNKKVMVTGGAGFIGSNIVDRLVAQGNKVVVYDNFVTGNVRFLENAVGKVGLIKADLLDTATLNKAMKGVDFVFHLAANADIKLNLKEPLKCLEQNTIATSNVLEAMRLNGVKEIAFASTGTIYGDSPVHPTPEDAPFPIQTSLYGASKVACEGLLQAYSEGYGFNIYIFRFVSLMGERYTHGCVFDFYKKLRANPKELVILGDGKQRKSYIYVKDCIEGIFRVVETSKERVNIINVGHDDYIEVTPIAKLVCEELGLKNVKFKYTGGKRGWVGDGTFIHLDNSRLKAYGWKPTVSIPECVRRTTRWLRDNKYVFETRD
jgi:UDP-glucose 4-epimerase